MFGSASWKRKELESFPKVMTGVGHPGGNGDVATLKYDELESF